MAKELSVSLRIEQGSDIDRFMQAQDIKTKSINALIELAYRQYGKRDIFQALLANSLPKPNRK